MASVLYTGFRDISLGKIRGLLAGTSFFPIDLAVAKKSLLQNSDAVLIGPDSPDVIWSIQKIVRADPQITVIVLCYDAASASLKAEIIFKPFIGKYTALYVFEDLEPQSLQIDLERSRQRRNYAKIRAGLGKIALTNPAILPIEHLGTFLEQAPIGAILLDNNLQITTTNGLARKLFSLHENSSGKLGDLFDEMQVKEIRNLISDIGDGKSIEIQLGLKFLAINAAEVVNELGDPFVILLINDVTDQTLEKQRIAKILDAMPQMGWLTDRSGSVLHLTEGWFNYTGQDHNDKSKWEDYIWSEDLGRVLDQWKNSLLKGKGFEQEARYKMHTGEYRWHLARAVPIYDNNGEVEYWLGIATDITQQKAVEADLETLVNERTEKLILANERLAKSNSDLAEFAHIASHDLQEPLRKIRIFTNMIRANIGNEEKLQQNIDKIEDASTRMSDLIKGILNHSNIANSDDEFTAVELDKIMGSVVKDFDILLQERQGKILVGNLPVVNGAELQLQQLFANLISNALKYNTGTPVIKISAKTVLRESAALPIINNNEQYYEIAVEDNGIGFDEQYADKIFAIFGRLHSKSHYSGTGIGLALCKKIVDRHHGYIGARSSEGDGATFFVYLPV